MKSFTKKVLMSLFAVVLAVSSLAMYAHTAYAATADAFCPRWSYLTMIRAGMEVDDRNCAKISVTCNSDIFDTSKVAATCELQQLNGSWKTIKTWKEENNSNFIMYDKEWAIAKKYSYRLKVTASAYKGSKLLESATAYFDYGYYQ